MKIVTIKDGSGELVEVLVSDDVFEVLEKARRADETQKRIDRARLSQEELSDYHQNILLHPQRLMSDMVEEKLLIEQMLNAMASLSDYERLLIHKRFYERATYVEIAKEIGISRQAVERRLSRSIGKLAKHVDP